MKNYKEEIEFYRFYELTEEEQNKLQGDAFPSSVIKIKWVGRTEIDRGYLFQLPKQDEDIDMGDFMVHVPNPDNSDGMDSAPPVWVHLNALLSNELVKWIKCSRGLKN